MEKVLRWAADHWAAIAVALSLFIDWTPRVKWNPWKSLIKALGNALFGDFRKSLEKLQTTLDNHIREDEDDKARNQRYRILRFYDEMCDHWKHSESHFEDILDDIDEYEQYCKHHPDFKNNRGKAAMEYIKDSYADLKPRGEFLTHNTDRPAKAGE